MSIGKLSAAKNIIAKQQPLKLDSFKSVMKQKMSAPKADLDQNITAMVQKIHKNHHEATKIVKSFMNTKKYSPRDLLVVQYKTGVLLLREQMFFKSAEMISSTLKTFTQTQI